MDTKKTIGTDVRVRRARLGWSQSELARAAGISRQYVSQLEAELKAPTTDTLYKLALAFQSGPSAYPEEVEAFLGLEPAPALAAGAEGVGG